MTDLPPVSPLPEPLGDEADLLASLYLDGEATAEERALVEGDPAIMARVDEFRSMASNVTPVTVPSGLAASQIAAALDEFDRHLSAAPTTEIAAVPAAVDTASVTSLSERRRRAAVPAWLGAAAVAALVVGGIGFAATRSGSDDAASDTAAPSLSGSATNEAAEARSSDAVEESMADSIEMEAEMEAEMADAGSDLQADDAGAGDGDDAADDAADDATTETAPIDPAAAAEAAAAFYDENGPVLLGDLEADTAAGYVEQLTDAPLLPIDASPCAESPVMADIVGVDSFIPVVFADEPASLVLQAGAPETARIIGPTCELELS